METGAEKRPVVRDESSPDAITLPETLPTHHETTSWGIGDILALLGDSSFHFRLIRRDVHKQKAATISVPFARWTRPKNFGVIPQIYSHNGPAGPSIRQMDCAHRHSWFGVDRFLEGRYPDGDEFEAEASACSHLGSVARRPSIRSTEGFAPTALSQSASFSKCLERKLAWGSGHLTACL